MAKFRVFAGTRRVHFGNGWHARARATSRGKARNILESFDCDPRSRSSCKQTIGVARPGATLSPSFAREEVRRTPSPTPSRHRRPGRGLGPPTLRRQPARLTSLSASARTGASAHGKKIVRWITERKLLPPRARAGVACDRVSYRRSKTTLASTSRRSQARARAG